MSECQSNNVSGFMSGGKAIEPQPINFKEFLVLLLLMNNQDRKNYTQTINLLDGKNGLIMNVLTNVKDINV